MNTTQKYIAAFVVLKLVTLSAIAVLFVLILSGQDRARINSCRDSRVLIATIILRGFGTDYATYRKDPEATLERFRSSLQGNAFYRRNPELIDRAVAQTRSALVLADPRRCH